MRTYAHLFPPVLYWFRYSCLFLSQHYELSTLVISMFDFVWSFHQVFWLWQFLQLDAKGGFEQVIIIIYKSEVRVIGKSLYPNGWYIHRAFPMYKKILKHQTSTKCNSCFFSEFFTYERQARQTHLHARCNRCWLHHGRARVMQDFFKVRQVRLRARKWRFKKLSSC